MRLNKYLASSGICSRRKADELIKNGEIKINNKVVSDLGTIVNEKKDKVEFDGRILSLPSSFAYIKINKPKGYICSASDEKGRKIVLDLVKDVPVRLFSVGRLDYDSEGLLLLTNDGEFANHIAHPSHHLDKIYVVTVEGDIFESELAVMRKGVVLENGERMPSARVIKKGFKDGVSRLEITIDEGQNRQIRRMFEAINRSIIMLKRVQIGEVKLGGLSRGEWKDLTDLEISSLMKN